jgi:hypothetical protein
MSGWVSWVKQLTLGQPAKCHSLDDTIGLVHRIIQPDVQGDIVPSSSLESERTPTEGGSVVRVTDDTGLRAEGVGYRDIGVDYGNGHRRGKVRRKCTERSQNQ